MRPPPTTEGDNTQFDREILTDETAVRTRGLAIADAVRRLAEHGPNELRRAEPTSPWRICR